MAAFQTQSSLCSERKGSPVHISNNSVKKHRNHSWVLHANQHADCNATWVLSQFLEVTNSTDMCFEGQCPSGRNDLYCV